MIIRGLGAVALLLLAALPARAEWITLALPTGPTLQADVQAPADLKTLERVPGVIYLHGRSVRQNGYDAEADRGYDITAFTRAFADAGFIAIAPVRETPVGSESGDEAVSEGIAA